MRGFRKWGVRARMLKKFRGFSRYLKYSKSWSVARRYFATNAFDFSLTVISVLIGSLIFEIRTVKTIVGLLLSVGIAGVLSGVAGVLIVEFAEKRKDLEELERGLLRNLNNTIFYRYMIAAVFLSVVMQALSVIIPVFLAISILLYLKSLELALKMSIGLEVSLLFGLGFIIGWGSLKRAVLLGLAAVTLGLLLTLINMNLNALWQP